MRDGAERPYRGDVARNPTLTRRVVDGLVALAFLAIGWISSGAPTTSDPAYAYTPRDWLFVLLLVLATVPYAWRRRWPTAAFLISLLATDGVVAARLQRRCVAADPAFRWLFRGGCSPGSGRWWRASLRRLAASACCGGRAVRRSALGTRSRRSSRSAITLALGRTGRLRVDLAEARAQAAEEAARRRSTEERLRIARELHDIIGHSLGTIAVQAGVGRHLMATEPERAAEALDSIARVSRSSLDEVRAVVAALREDEPDYHPAPGLADLPDLVETVRSTGLTVELTLPDDLEAIPRQTGAAVYRITREALTNVVRHAHASAASVRVDHRDGRVEVAVRDDGSGIGRRTGAWNAARVTASRGCGSEPKPSAAGCRPAPRPAGGFLVTASLPVASDRPR